MNPIHIAFIAMIALIFLGPKRLPELAKTLGAGMREFRETMNLDGGGGANPLAGVFTPEAHTPATADLATPLAPVPPLAPASQAATLAPVPPLAPIAALRPAPPIPPLAPPVSIGRQPADTPDAA